MAAKSSSEMVVGGSASTRMKTPEKSGTSTRRPRLAAHRRATLTCRSSLLTVAPCITDDPYDFTPIKCHSPPSPAFPACDLAIGHGTHGFTSSALLAGKPQLMIPLVLEQRLTSTQVMRLGTGVVGESRDGKSVIVQLRKVWESKAIAEATRMFAESRPPRMCGVEEAFALVCSQGQPATECV